MEDSALPRLYTAQAHPKTSLEARTPENPNANNIEKDAEEDLQLCS